MWSASFLPHMNHVSVHVHCRDFNIFSSHGLLPSDLVAQLVEQQWANPKVVGSVPTLVRVSLSLCGPISISRADAHMVHNYGIEN